MTIGVDAAAHAGVWASFRASPLAVRTVLLGVFINRLSGFLNIFLVLYLIAKGFSTQQAAIALGVYGGGAIVGSLVGGILAVRLGARTATVISMAGTSVLMAALLYLPSYALLLAAICLVGLSAQLYRPASATLLSELTPANRQVMIFAMYRFGLNLGATVAPLLGLALYNLDGGGYSLLFWCEALIALAYAVLAWTTLPARRAGPTAVKTPAAAGSTGGYLAVVRERRYLLYLIATFCHSAVYVQYLSTLPLDVKAAGLAIFWYTLAVSLNGFIVIAFELLITKLTQTWPWRLTIGLGMGLLAAGVAFYGLPLGPAVIIVGTLIWSIGEIIGGPAMFAYPGMAGRSDLKGHYIGSFQFMFGLGTAAGPVLGGWLFVQLGHSAWPVLAIGSVVATTLAMAAVWRAPTSTQAGPASTPPAEPTPAGTGGPGASGDPSRDTPAAVPDATRAP
jgi:predicted MFS family arabinose efflux permease